MPIHCDICDVSVSAGMIFIELSVSAGMIFIELSVSAGMIFIELFIILSTSLH